MSDFPQVAAELVDNPRRKSESVRMGRFTKVDLHIASRLRDVAWNIEDLRKHRAPGFLDKPLRDLERMLRSEARDLEKLLETL